MNGWTYRLTDGWMDRQMDERKNGESDKWMDG